MNRKNKYGVTPAGLLKMVIMLAMIAVVLFPLIWLAAGSLKVEKEIIGYPPSLLGTKYTLKSFQRIFKTIPMAIYIKNTVIFAGGATFLSVIFDSMTGYAFARLEFKGKNLLFMLVLMTMMVPFQVMMIPLFLESNFLGLLDTYTGLILPKATSAFGIFMMRSYFAALPRDLEEAARVDGMSEFGIFTKIMFPLVLPGVLTLTIFHLMQNWNNLLYPLMMTSSTRMRTLSAGLALFVGEHATTYYGPQLAGALLSILPLLIIYIFFQKYFIASVATSGLKD
ncbi:carbohydrate ABC transporter permease [Kineothrix sp. MB12-C1]|uniref:carbohydrate ABC transporter permease n=1 Tax=Kineothrix sp. MB12-C1 TaxID=3070215 RepID=UPI0027D2EC07|nr:carbohydrate ABC transporter permease [Kineothrix sp. MB12-C1]WMC91575.1 carbohydrate ABC transporter permease [Kineothrix sp. MB12-C1]